MFRLVLELWGWFTIHLKDMNLRIEMSGETFPTALWFKSYSENSRVLTVLWDTLYNQNGINNPYYNLTLHI